jgi:hypothetical protein
MASFILLLGSGWNLWILAKKRRIDMQPYVNLGIRFRTQFQSATKKKVEGKRYNRRYGIKHSRDSVHHPPVISPHDVGLLRAILQFGRRER